MFSIFQSSVALVLIPLFRSLVKDSVWSLFICRPHFKGLNSPRTAKSKWFIAKATYPARTVRMNQGFVL